MEKDLRDRPLTDSTPIFTAAQSLIIAVAVFKHGHHHIMSSLSISETVVKSDVDAASKSASFSSSNININDGSELIVDFGQPQRQRQIQLIRQGQGRPFDHAHTNTNTNTTNINSNSKGEGWSTSTKHKQVRFSDETRIHTLPYPSEEELLQRWHSKKDKIIFKQGLVRDVRNIRHLLSSIPMEELEKEVLYWCLGLEALVSIQVTRFLREMKVRHSRSIVQLQHHLSDEQLAAYAMRSSLQSRERAHDLAAGNWEILP